MKTITKWMAVLIFLVSTFIIFGCDSANKQPQTGLTDNFIVIVKYKAQQSKSSDAVSELVKLIEKVKQEPHFINLKLHVDPKDDTNILLYEEWDDASYYNSEHMNTAHLQEFIANSRNFLSGPPEISFWNIEREFK